MSETEAGSPSSAMPHGMASTGQPSALNGNVSRMTDQRRSISSWPIRGATVVSVGATRRSNPAAISAQASR